RGLLCASAEVASKAKASPMTTPVTFIIARVLQSRRTWNARSGLRSDLHVDSVGVLDVQTGQVALQGSRAALGQIARDRFPREAGNPDREVIHSAGRTS